MKNIQPHFSFMKAVFPAVCLLALSGGVARAQTVVAQPQTSAITPTQQQVELGPVLDVVPYILSDGYTINLALMPSFTEFDGYEAQPNIPIATAGLNVVQLPSVLPKFTVRQVITTVNVWDNQTVVLGGLISSHIENTKDKVPIIGDVPMLGRLFQSGSKTSAKKNLMIFVTATVVDPAGNRVHSDDQLPFTQNPSAQPPQPPGAGQIIETKSEQVHMPKQ